MNTDFLEINKSEMLDQITLLYNNVYRFRNSGIQQGHTLTDFPFPHQNINFSRRPLGKSAVHYNLIFITENYI